MVFCSDCGRQVPFYAKDKETNQGLTFCNINCKLAYIDGVKPTIRDDLSLPLDQKVAMAVTLAVIIGLIIVLWSMPSRAHSMAHPEYNAALQELKDGEGHSCCNQGDMSLLHRTEDWKMEDGQYSVRLFNEWFPVPESATHMNGRVPEQPTEGKAVVWYRSTPHHEGGEQLVDKIHIYCFQPGLQA